jgi:hypothetical protein
MSVLHTWLRIYLNEYHSISELITDVDDYIEFYNHRRFHETLAYKKPMEPIKFVNYASGGVNKWSISHQLPSGLVFDKQKGIISGTPTSSTTVLLWAIALIVERPSLRAVTLPVD